MTSVSCTWRQMKCDLTRDTDTKTESETGANIANDVHSEQIENISETSIASDVRSTSISEISGGEDEDLSSCIGEELIESVLHERIREFLDFVCVVPTR